MSNNKALLSTPPLIVRTFQNLQDYSVTFDLMKKFTEVRDSTTSDEIWILQHQDVLTQGQSGKPEHVLTPSNLPIVQSDRGGQVTWHGKGQLIIYFLLDLNRLNWHVRTLVNFAENLMINLLKKYQIDGYAKPDAPGVYVNEKKIGSLGFKIRRGRSYHGLALNINCDLFGFSTINPCGYAGLEMVRLCDLISPIPTMQTLQQDIFQYLQETSSFSSIILETE